ncbi:MAG: MobC family plasmid mobilization relaxosome protein, partial [Oscillospiraceae bacterium]|nr:MobC family plasmid mobilization relaxosome protein [Oscillospiraceae bacterium]
QTGIRNLRAYLLKMAVDGMVVNLDLSEVNECSRLLRNIGNNINQLAKRANEGGNVYTDEIADVKAQLGEIWEQQNKIIRSLAKILEVV